MADRFDNTSQAVPGLSLPFSSEAEQSVLGAVLLDSSCLDPGDGDSAPQRVLLPGEQPHDL